MTLRLYYHPLSNFCQKALVALYESGVDFTPEFIDLGNEDDRARLGAVWPMVKFPVLVDEERGETVPEATVIIEYLNDRHPAPAPLIPADKEAARAVRLMDRFFDLHVNQHLFSVVSDRLKPEERKDPAGVEEAKAKLAQTYGFIDGQMADREWAGGRRFQHGGLRRRAHALLCRPDRALRRTPEPRRLFRTADEAAILCPRLRGSRALPAHVSRRLSRP